MNSERSTVKRWLTLSACLFSTISPLAAQIQDNSFLLEEAYNQEAGVVQHINAFTRSTEGNWAYAFTQEWPLGGINHQLSYTIPLQHSDPGGTGLGDIALNYRYQLIGNPKARTVMAPRLSVLLPTGNDEFERGTGGVSYQGNLPLTLVLGPELTTHWNAGLTVSPFAHNTVGAQATTTSINLGASAIWLARPDLNLILETVWLSTESVLGEDVTDREEFFLLNPGIRMAFDVSGGLQIVPGIAYTIGMSPAELNNAVFLYLSLEHPFKRQ